MSIESTTLQIVLSALDAPLATAWQTVCGDLDCVQVHRGSILDLNVDAVISPANSFGFMDGGIDMRYSRHFGGCDRSVPEFSEIKGTPTGVGGV